MDRNDCLGFVSNFLFNFRAENEVLAGVNIYKNGTALRYCTTSQVETNVFAGLFCQKERELGGV